MIFSVAPSCNKIMNFQRFSVLLFSPKHLELHLFLGSLLLLDHKELEGFYLLSVTVTVTVSVSLTVKILFKFFKHLCPVLIIFFFHFCFFAWNSTELLVE